MRNSEHPPHCLNAELLSCEERSCPLRIGLMIQTLQINVMRLHEYFAPHARTVLPQRFTHPIPVPNKHEKPLLGGVAKNAKPPQTAYN